MSLANKLAAAKSPAEHDSILQQVWLNFRGSEAWEALSLALRGIETEAESALLNPHSSPYVRAHAAGQVTSARRLLATARAATELNLQNADYSDPGAEDDVPSDDDQLI
jgi:hypothetical protein